MHPSHVIIKTFFFIKALLRIDVKTLNFMQIDSDLKASSVYSSSFLSFAVSYGF